MRGIVDDAQQGTLDAVHERLNALHAQLEACTRSLELAAREESMLPVVAAVVHDLNNSLTAVCGYLSRSQCGDSHEGTTGPVIHRCAQAAAHCQNLALMLAEIISGSGIAARAHERCAVGDAASQAITLVLGARPQLAIEYLTPPGALRVKVERAALVRVLQNLLVNAADAGAKRVVVEAEQAAGAVGEGRSVATRGEWVRLLVRDDGPGMPEHVRAGLFRGWPRTGQAVAGRGLGLWICRSLVEAAGGVIGVESAVGEGTVFTILLPAAAGST